MAANLIVSLSQSEAKKPYKFGITNINVYSLEEALYHCYHYWKQSVDDFLSEEFIAWVSNTLGLSLIVSRLKEISEIDNFTLRYLAFLSVTDYFSKAAIAAIEKELINWEKRLEWEKLKERADFLVEADEPEKALSLYKKALNGSENVVLYNNAGIALMKQGKSGDAAAYFERALETEPENITIILNYLEALILSGSYEEARKTLKYAAKFGDISDLEYFKGELEFYTGSYFTSVSHYERAIQLKYDPAYIYRLCDVFIKLRQFDKAVEALEDVNPADKNYLSKRAEIYAAYNNVPAAVKCVELALNTDKTNVDLWVSLARYYRLDYDLQKANDAIVNALSLAPANPKANLEFARIRKAQGRIKDYQVILNGVLKGFKEDYRESLNMECL